MTDADLTGLEPTDHLTHVETARAVAGWLLHKQRHQAATWEVGGPRVQTGEKRTRRVPKRGTDGLVDWVEQEEPVLRGTQLDAVGVEARVDRKPAVSIAEVKVSRADLLADLRARKMLGYEQLNPTKLYLAITPWVIGLNPYGWPVTENGATRDIKSDIEARRAALDKLTDELAAVLPSEWGLLFVHRWSLHNGRPEVQVIRAAKRRPVEPDVVGWLGRIAARYSYTALTG